MDKSVCGGIEIERYGDTVVVTPSGELDELHSEAVAQVMGQVRDELKESRCVVFDLQRTTYFGSSALNEFVLIWKALQSRQARMGLCRLSSHQREILSITGLDRQWPVFDSREDAIQATGP